MTFGLTAAAVASVGVGLSAASAAGAFSSSVDPNNPTPQELEAAEWARKVNSLGQRIEAPLNKLARKDIAYLGSREALDRAGDQGVNQAVNPLYAQMQAALQQSMATTGGPGSGRFWNTLGRAGAGMDAAYRGAEIGGRLGGINTYMGRMGQFLDRRTNTLKTGLTGMTTGGAQAAQNQQARIQAQIRNNIAANQAMGQLGGALTSVGMAGVGAAGGLGAVGGMGGSLNGAETGLSVMQPALQNAAATNPMFQYLYGG